MIKLKTTIPASASGATFALSSLVLSTALLLGTTAPVMADFTVANGQTETDQTVTLTTGQTGTIEAGGKIEDSTTHAITATGSVTVDNAGTVATTAVGFFIGVRHTAGVLTLVNRATGAITSIRDDGVNADAITSLINSGTITGFHEGVEVDGTLGSLINSGTITAGKDGVEATAITSLINSGTITSTGADGVIAALITSLINSGTITGLVDGVFSNGTITSLTNSGTIKGGDDGVDVSVTIGSLVNTGTITGTAGHGIEVATLTSLINTGTITGAVSGVAATKITSLTNSGKISGGTYAIRETAAAADSLLTLLPGSDIFGKIDLLGGTNKLVIGNGLSIDHVFDFAAPEVNANGAPLVVVGTRVVSVDTTALAQQDDLMFDLSNGIIGTVFSQLNNQASSGGAPALSYAATSSAQSAAIEANFGDSNNDRFRMWTEIFGSHRAQDGTTAATDAQHKVGGLIFGLDSEIDSTTTLGVFFGASKTDIETGANQQSDVKGYFGGLYAGLNADNMSVHLGITGGKTDHNGTRIVDNNQINGVEIAARTFNGTFFAPEIAVSGQYDVGGTTLQPTVSVGYTGVFLDGYTETGTSAPLTVAARDLHILHARFELAALLGAKSQEDETAFIPYLGVEGRSLIGGKSINATLLGQNLSFTGGADNIASVFLGARLSVAQTQGFGVSAGLEASYDTEQSTTVTGNIEFKMAF